MNSDLRILDNLATRTERGEREAAVRLGEMIAPRMVMLVRRVLRAGRGSSPLDRRILAEAARLRAPTPDCPRDDEGLVRQIARRLCDNLVREGRPGDTVLTHAPGETVLA